MRWTIFLIQVSLLMWSTMSLHNQIEMKSTTDSNSKATGMLEVDTNVVLSNKSEKVNYWVLVFMSLGLLHMSLWVFWLQLDVARRNNDPVFLQFASESISLVHKQRKEDQIAAKWRDKVKCNSSACDTAFLETATKASERGDKCDIDVDPILVRLDWQVLQPTSFFVSMLKF